MTLNKPGRASRDENHSHDGFHGSTRKVKTLIPGIGGGVWRKPVIAS